MKWFLAELECPICGDEQVSLHPGPAREHGFECDGCGYMIQSAEEEREVPESFARAEHRRFGLYWGRHGIDGPYDNEGPASNEG
jgi:predicted RNA-binding Zn-ribbon protein involved in translation (DUF1610 family)